MFRKVQFRILLTLTMLMGCCAVSNAQKFQPIMIRATKKPIVLNARSRVGVVPGFCVNQGLPAPVSKDKLSHFSSSSAIKISRRHNGVSSEHSLEEAIERGFIEASGVDAGLGIRFKAVDSADYEINVAESVIGSVTPAGQTVSNDIISSQAKVDALMAKIESEMPSDLPFEEYGLQELREALAWKIINLTGENATANADMLLEKAGNRSPEFKKYLDKVLALVEDLPPRMRGEDELRRDLAATIVFGMPADLPFQEYGLAELKRALAQKSIWELSNPIGETTRTDEDILLDKAKSKSREFKDFAETVLRSTKQLAPNLSVKDTFSRVLASFESERYDYYVAKLNEKIWLVSAGGEIIKSSPMDSNLDSFFPENAFDKRVFIDSELANESSLGLNTESLTRMSIGSPKGERSAFFENTKLSESEFTGSRLLNVDSVYSSNSSKLSMKDGFVVIPKKEGIDSSSAESLESMFAVLNNKKSQREKAADRDRNASKRTNISSRAKERLLARNEARRIEEARDQGFVRGLEQHPALTPEILAHASRVHSAQNFEVVAEGDHFRLKGDNVSFAYGELEASKLHQSDLLRFGDKGDRKDPLVIIDVRKLDDVQLQRLTQSLRTTQNSSNIEFYFATSSPEVAAERFVGMHNPEKVTIVTDDSINDIPSAKGFAVSDLESISNNIKSKSTDSNGAELEILLGHKDLADDKLIDKWKEKAEAGDFEGKHIVAVACNSRNQSRLFEVARIALSKGNARSFVTPSDTVNSAAFVLATAKINEVGLANKTPVEIWKSCYVKAAQDIAKVRESDNKLETFRELFDGGEKFLFKGENFQEKAADQLESYFKRDPDLMWEFTEHRGLFKQIVIG